MNHFEVACMSADLNLAEHPWKELKLAVGRRHLLNLRELEHFHQKVSKVPAEKCVKATKR